MNFYRWVSTLFKRASTKSTPLPSGRVSTNNGRTSTRTSNFVMTPPLDAESFWRFSNLDTNYLDWATPQELLDLLADLSPDVSYAIWQFQRLCNPGWELKVYNLGTDKVENPKGKAHLDAFFATLRDLYGSVDVVLGRYFIGAFLRGAFVGELVLNGRDTVDLVAPDPFSIRFKKKIDPIRGEVWIPGQYQDFKFTELNIPTFRYVPVDPAPASPYGRSLASPSLFTSVFILSLMHDIKRVVMQQGYKRMDISVNSEQAQDNYLFDNQGYASFNEYFQAAIASVKSIYSTLEPDDAFIHSDMFTINSPTGAVDSDSMIAIDKIIERLEGMVTRALKSNRVVMDTGDNTNETDSNRKWEIFAAGIKSLQHLCENMLESLFTLSLQAAGIQARVEFRFAELRAAEMFRDEQTRTLRIQNSRAEYDAGYVSQDEAANKAVNHDADVPEPRSTTQPSADLIDSNNSGGEVLNRPSMENSTIAISRIPDKVILNGHTKTMDLEEVG